MDTDLLKAALQEVNWLEIAERYAAEVDRDGIEKEKTGTVRVGVKEGDDDRAA
jgi:hypothetical protein